MSKPIVVVGSINMDMVVAAARLPASGETLIGHSFCTYHGGKGANQAYAVARLGYPVVMCGTVGDDGFGDQLRAGLAAVGVDTQLVETVPGPSGVAMIVTGDGGENNIVVVPGANAAMTPARLEASEAHLKRAGMLLAQLEIPIECIHWLAAFASRNDIPLMLDPAPARELPPSILRNVAWLTPNETETRILLGGMSADNASAADQLIALGAGNVLLKLGANGCLVAPKGRPKTKCEAVRVQAVDTTAAGDAFNAAFAIGLSRGESAPSAARFATIVAGLSVLRRGAQPSMPSSEDVERFLATLPSGVMAHVPGQPTG